MNKKYITKLVDSKFADFEDSINSDDDKAIKLRPACLIPTSKAGDEITLTSIFLSGLRLIKEFKKEIFSEVKLPNNGKMYVYTEVTFPNFTDEKDSRIDGLIIIVIGGKIKDAALLEMKNGKSKLEHDQISRYIKVAKAWNISKIITVSNEYVSVSTQTPLDIKPPDNFGLYHLSWSYILTKANLLLFKNANNIVDEDQVEIMKEIAHYFESRISGICGFTQMKKGWSETAKAINSGNVLKNDNSHVLEAVSSWQQEEQDMALMLSRKLGMLVNSGQTQYKKNLAQRLDKDCDNLIKKKYLQSKLQVKNAVSDIQIKAMFDTRTVEMSVNLRAPLDRGTKAQLGWIYRQIVKCQDKDPKLFAKISEQLRIGIDIKYAKLDERITVDQLEDVFDDLKTKQLNGFFVIMIKDFGSGFYSTQKFITEIEQMLLDYYKGIVEHLSKWVGTAPKLKESESSE